MAEIQMPQVGGHDLLGGVRGSVVREMAVPSKNTLLQTPGTAGTILQHLNVMIRLQHQRMGWANPFEHQPRGMAKGPPGNRVSRGGGGAGGNTAAAVSS